MSRRIDLSLFQGDDSDQEDDLAVANPVELNEQKAKTFKFGVTKKTKWDLEKEAEEKKRMEEEEATKLALQEFSAAFATPGGRPVQGRDGWRSQTRGFVRAGENTIYNPIGGDRAPPNQYSQPPSNAPPVRLPSPPPPPKRKGKRAMDSFLEEIKSNQEAREAKFGKIANREGTSITSLASQETIRPGIEQATSNLFVVNLPTNVSEDSLGHLFCSVGPVGTVKIMWPRGEDEFGATSSRRNRPPLTGFVSFMTRADAEQAIATFDQFDWHGSTLRVSWSSRPVPIPRRPAYVSSDADTRQVKKPRNEVEPEEPQDLHVALSWFERVPPEQAKFIQAVADRIKSHGDGFRNLLMEREVDNPQFKFLFNKELPDYHVFQYCLDDGYHFPELPPPHFDDDGYASVRSTDSGEEGERGKNTTKGALGPLARRRFEAMLRSMSGKRVEIARAMEFSLKRADAADEVANLICESLRIDNTPIPRKMARLHLISDILHNSASPLPNVWKYRQTFEKQLPAIFAHFADVYDRLLVYSGSIAADIFRQQVDAVLSIWERWIVFTADVHDGLKRLLHAEVTLDALLAPPAPEEKADDQSADRGFKSAGFKSSFKRIGQDEPTTATAAPPAMLRPTGGDDQEPGNVDGQAMEDLDGEDLDGEVIGDEDLDGDAIGEGVDGEAIRDDVDGEAIEDDDLDGEAM